MADLDTIKIVLRSLLISTQSSLSVYDLQRDYRLSEGQECPYSALGYRSFLAFLESIPDTVIVCASGQVKAVSTKETQHIQQLVALQRCSKKRSSKRSSYLGSKPSGGGGGGFYPPKLTPSYRPYGSGSRSYGGSNNKYYSGGSSYGGGTRPQGTSYGGGTRPQGTSYGGGTRPQGTSYGGGARPQGTSYGSYGGENRFRSSQPQPLYQSRCTRDFPPSSSIEDYFQKVREVKNQARREELGSIAFSTTVTKPSPALAVNPLPSNAVQDNFIRVKEVVSEEAVQREMGSLASTSPKMQTDNLYHRRIVPAGKESSDDSDDSFYERFHDPEDNHSVQVKTETPSATLDDDESPLVDYFDSSNKVNDVLKCNLKNLIKSYPSGLWACVLPEKYKEKFGVRLNWNELGYDSIIQMAHDLQDIFECKRVKSGDWKLYDVSYKISDDDNDSKPVINVPQSVKKKIFDIAKKYKSGIRGEQLAQLYEEYYGRSLSSEAPGFSKVEDMLTSLHNSVIRVRYIRRECYVYPGDKPEEQLMPSLELDVKEKQHLGLYPEEVMGPGKTFSLPELPPNTEPGDYLELRVAEVYNPHKFWIMLRQDYHTLNRLMDELQDFYQDHGGKYVMPDCTIVEGQCCVAMYDGEWHRSVIKSVGETIEVLYVDYGTVAKCPKSDLRFIHDDFSVLPKQAVRASLSGLEPPKGQQRFAKEAGLAFLKLVIDRDLVGLIQKADPEEPYFELFLVDTNGETDIHLNDVLVNDGHASFKDDLLETADLIKEINGETEESCPLTETKSCEKETGDEKTGACPVSSTQSPIITPLLTNCTSSLPQSLNDQYGHSTAFPSVPTVQSQSQGTSAPHMPPPGFGGSQTSSIGYSVPSTYPYMVNSFNPLVNPALAAYSASGMSQVGAAFLMQQQQQWQQQQALVMAYYYQNLYQQSAAALLNAQSRAPTDNAGSASSSFCQQQTTDKTSHKTKSVVSQRTPLPLSLSEISSPEMNVDEETSRGKSPCIAAEMEAPTSSSSSSEGYSLRNRVSSRRKKSIHSSQINSRLQQRIALSDTDSSEYSPVQSSSSSCQNVAPDLVQSVGNLNLSYSNSFSVTNFWKTVEIGGHTLHVFNIDQRGFVSTGELARKFTQFSTCDTLVRVLKNVDISPPYSKLLRKEKLPLFSALDGYDGDIKSFDLSRNKNGSVTGTFHLTPLTNVPSIVISLGLHTSIVKEFQLLRDSFNPNDKYWTE